MHWPHSLGRLLEYTTSSGWRFGCDEFMGLTMMQLYICLICRLESGVICLSRENNRPVWAEGDRLGLRLNANQGFKHSDSFSYSRDQLFSREIVHVGGRKLQLKFETLNLR